MHLCPRAKDAREFIDRTIIDLGRLHVDDVGIFKWAFAVLLVILRNIILTLFIMDSEVFPDLTQPPILRVLRLNFLHGLNEYL